MKRENRDIELFGIVLSDSLVQLLVVVLFLALVMAACFSLQRKSQSDNEEKPIGHLCAELSWPDDVNVDLDLWGRGPDGAPVGYNHMHSHSLDLFKDVLGKSNNPTGHMSEIMCSLNTPPGEYRFNVHYFDNYGRNPPDVEARVTITDIIKTPKGDTNLYKKVLTGKYVMTFVTTDHNDPHAEKTFFDFYLDKDGRIIESSINSLDDPIRNKSVAR